MATQATFQLGVVLAIGFSLATAALNAVAINSSSLILPSIRITDLQDVTVARGQPAYFHCDYHSSEVASDVIWYLNGTKLPLKDDRWHIFENGTLYVPKVGGKRKSILNGTVEGGYRCAVKNRDGAVISNNAKLKIAVMGDFVKQPEDIKVTEGHPVVLHCSITSSPDATYVWERDNSALPQNIRYVPLKTGSLLIPNVHSSDVGSYRCKASNSYLKKPRWSKSAKLDVALNNPKIIVPPTILPIDLGFNVTVLVGNDVTLYCVVDGFPKPTIRWLNDDRISIGNSTGLSLKNVTLHMSGTYTCTARNSAGIISQRYFVSVHQAPYFNVTPASKIYPSSKTIRLDCHILGIPAPRVVWYKNGSPFHTDSTFGRAHYQMNTLLISYSVASDAGFYQCVGINSAGVVSATAMVKMNFSANTPKAPTIIQCHPYNGTSMCLQWSNVSNAQAYNILAFHPGEILKEYITHRTFTLADRLIPNTNYTFLVRSFSKEASNEFSQITCETGRIDVRKVTVHKQNDNSVKVVWSEISGDDNPCLGEDDTSYKVQWRKVNQTSVNVVHTKGFKWIVKNLIPGTSYEFRVQSNAVQEDSHWVKYGVPADNSTDFNWDNELDPPYFNESSVPSIPTHLDASPTSTQSVNLTWIDTSGGSVDYTVCYVALIENKPCENAKTITSSSNFIEILNLKPKTDYEFKVRTNKNGMQSSFSHSIQITTPSDVPSSVVELKYQIINATTACIKWEAPKYENGRLTGYLIKYSPNISWPLEQWFNINLFLPYKNKGCWNSELPRIISIPLRNLNPNKQYMVIVVATNEAGVGNPTMPITVSTAHLISDYLTPREEKSPSTDEDIFYKQGVGVLLGLGISTLFMAVCLGCFLIKKKYVRMQAISRGRQVSSSNRQFGDNLSVNRQENCNADAHEMQQLVEGNGAVYIPTHLDTKVRIGGVEFPNGQLNGSLKKTYFNGNLPNSNVHITENPQYNRPKSNAKLEDELKHLNSSDPDYEEDSNSNIQRLPKIANHKFQLDRIKDHDSSLESTMDVSLNSTQLTSLDDFMMDSLRKISPTVGPNG